jgi:hypothetical protein
MNFLLTFWHTLRRWLGMSNKKERDEKKEIFAMDLIAIESAGIREELRCICHELKRLNEFLRSARGFEIKQIGGSGMAIIGIVKGATGTFVETPAPAGGQLQAGNIPVWTSDDTLTTLTPSTDGTSVNVATSATDPATSLNLKVSGVASDGTAISTTVNVPLLPPAVVPATGFTVNQTA